MKNRFDGLTKSLAQSVTHRGALKKFGVGLAGITLISLMANFRASAAPSYTTIDYPGGVFTVVGDISAKGHIVGRYIGTAGINHGFLLKAGIFTEVTVPGAVWTRAIGINRNGDIVGDYSLTDSS